MKRVIIVHGYNSTPERHWFPWLKRELETRGYTVIVPTLTGSLRPSKDAWQQALTQAIGPVDVETIFVGHSLGVIAALQYIQAQPEGTQCAGFIAVAPLVLPHFDMLFPGFFTEPLAYNVLRSKIPHITIFADRKDYLAPFKNTEHLAQEMQCTFTECHGRGHFNDVIDNVTEVPEVLEAILAIEKH